MVASKELSCEPSMLCITTPETMPVKPRMAPSERSMPPVMITKVWPMARSRNSTAYWDVLSQLALREQIGSQAPEHQDHQAEHADDPEVAGAVYPVQPGRPGTGGLALRSGARRDGPRRGQGGRKSQRHGTRSLQQRTC